MATRGNGIKAKIDSQGQGMDACHALGFLGAMIVYTFCTIAFYLFGCCRLGKIEPYPRRVGNDPNPSAMYQPALEILPKLFLFGAFAVLFSTFNTAIAAQGRLAVDVGTVMGIAKLNLCLRLK